MKAFDNKLNACGMRHLKLLLLLLLASCDAQDTKNYSDEKRERFAFMTHEIAYVNCIKLNIPKVSLYSQISILNREGIKYNCVDKLPIPQIEEFSIIIREEDLRPIDSEDERNLFYSYEDRRMTANQKSTLFGVLRYEANSVNTNLGYKTYILSFRKEENWRQSIAHEWGSKGTKYQSDIGSLTHESLFYEYDEMFISEDKSLGVFCKNIITDLEGENKWCLIRYWTKDKFIMFEGRVFAKNIGAINIAKSLEDVYEHLKLR